jgi:hypothetical protein
LPDNSILISSALQKEEQSSPLVYSRIFLAA